MGQRVEKEVIRNADTTKTLYVHDASGNIMAIYTLRNNDTLKLNEVPLYGSSRLGVWNANKVLRIDSVLHETELEEQDPQDPTTEGVTYIKAGEKQYSLSNHLDNVLATVSDRKIPVYDGGVLNHYKAEQITGNEYFAFGSLMPQRKFSIGKNYRWSFNGGEKINEIYDEDNYVDLGERGVDVRLGRLNWSVDPQGYKMPFLSSYSYAANNPILFIDQMGENPAIPVIVVGGVVITIADAALISFGLVTTGILLHKANDGSLSFNNSINYNPGWQWQKRESERNKEKARKEGLAHATLVGSLLKIYNDNQKGDGSNLRPDGNKFGKWLIGVGLTSALVKQIYEDIPNSEQNNTQVLIKSATEEVNSQAGLGTKTVTIKYDVNYTVQEGDNLTKIADKYGTSVDALAETNSIKDKNYIQAGQTLKVGEGSYSYSTQSNSK